MLLPCLPDVPLMALVVVPEAAAGGALPRRLWSQSHRARRWRGSSAHPQDDGDAPPGHHRVTASNPTSPGVIGWHRATLWRRASDARDNASNIEAAVRAILIDSIAGILQHDGSRHALMLGEEDTWTYEELLELDESVMRKGLSLQEVERLERRKLHLNDERRDCQICMSETCVGEVLVKLPCAHLYQFVNPSLLRSMHHPVVRDTAHMSHLPIRGYEKHHFSLDSGGEQLPLMASSRLQSVMKNVGFDEQ
eukprot:SM000157S02063  [mRNA]  locus=s157:46634:48862:- [translate_table: standard]